MIEKQIANVIAATVGTEKWIFGKPAKQQRPAKSEKGK